MLYPVVTVWIKAEPKTLWKNYLKKETLSSWSNLKYPQHYTIKYTRLGVKRHKITKETNIYLATHRILHLLWPRTIPISTICSVWNLVLWLPPLEDYDPCESFQKDSNASQCSNNTNVRMLPAIVAIPYVFFYGFEPFENVDDTDDYGSISDQVVVHIPVHSVLMVLVGPQEQRKHLKKTEKWHNLSME